MSKTPVHITFLLFTITVLSGILMRYLILFPKHTILTYDFILHGHSHVAILGWTFLGVFIIFLKLIWEQLEEKKQAISIVLTTFVITSCMFIAFLYQGYAIFSIIFSTLHIFVEYWMAVFIYKQIKKLPHIPSHSKLFINGAIISLVISTIGPFTLGGLGMAKLKDTPFFDMTIYVYLHFQYNGWLYMMLIGLFLFILHRKNCKLHSTLITYSFWIYMISLFPGFILTILWYGLGTTGIVLAVIGALGQLTAIVLLLYAIFQQRKALYTHFSKHIRVSLLFVFLLLAAKSLMELGLLYTPFATLIFETRSIIIGYLHLTLLGFVSIFILTQYQMVGLLNEQRNSVLYGTAIFIGGFLLNEVILFLTGSADWINLPLPFANELLFIASILLSIGIIIIWSSIMKKRTN